MVNEEKLDRLRSAKKSLKWTCTVNLAQDVLKNYPRHIPTLIMMGNALFFLARYGEARQVLLKINRLLPPSQKYLNYIAMGNLYWCKGEYRYAVRWYKKVALSQFKHTNDLETYGECLIAQGQLTAAKRCLRRAIKIATCPVDNTYYLLGVALRAEKKYDKAMECFRQSLKITPDFACKEDIQDLLDLKKLTRLSTKDRNTSSRTGSAHNSKMVI